MTSAWRTTVLTLFPEMFPGPLGVSLAGRALAAGLWALEARDIRASATDRHRSVDDTPAGGGPGMVLRADVLGHRLIDVQNVRLVRAADLELAEDVEGPGEAGGEWVLAGVDTRRRPRRLFGLLAPEAADDTRAFRDWHDFEWLIGHEGSALLRGPFARIRRLYYGAADPKGGAVDNGVQFFASPTCHHRPEVYGGLAEAEASVLLKDFFRERR